MKKEPTIFADNACLEMSLKQSLDVKASIERLFKSLLEPDRKKSVRILDSISIRVNTGERLGVIGRNGAGKTSFLRMVSGAYPPTSGKISVCGSLQAFLNTSIDFDMRRTALQNIKARLLSEGRSLDEVKDLSDRILTFSELRDYAETPVYTFSSGMNARLLFALSVELSAQILVLDEWLSVGDAAFVKKAERKMQDLVGQAEIIVIASHSPDLIKNVCNRAIVIERGRIVFDGSPGRACKYYESIS